MRTSDRIQGTSRKNFRKCELRLALIGLYRRRRVNAGRMHKLTRASGAATVPGIVGPRLLGKMLRHDRIVEKIGQGRMGVVFRSFGPQFGVFGSPPLVCSDVHRF
jgi:hypothetical protein